MPDTGRRRAGLLATLLVFAIYGGLAFFVDPVEARRTAVNPAAVPGFQGDEATYYMMGRSLALDGDLEYRREDLERTRREFVPGPNGVFLKRGVDVTGVRLISRPPFIEFPGVRDRDQSRLYYGKSFIYPLVAAPAVKIFGTRGFYVTNALLLALAFLCSYLFLSARSGITVSLLLSGAFVFATVVPVYFAWIAPELFNFSLGLCAYFCWLYKEVSPAASSRLTRWLRGPASDLVAAIIIGALTFSKVSNALLVGPVVIWLAWKRQWRQAIGVGLAWAVAAVALFGANVAITGEWNYQGGDSRFGGDRQTCYEDGDHTFPFSGEGIGLEACEDRGRTQIQQDVLFDRQVMWSNLRANLAYFVVGRNSGVAAYFFPAVLSMALMLLVRRGRQRWQWLVLGSVVAQALLFIISQPYTYFGSGGSVGNRYFMGAYGMAIFLFPPVRSIAIAVLPWIVGGLFMAPLVLSPFDTSIRPGDHAKKGPLRVLPVELTNVNDLPINTEGSIIKYWYGEDGIHPGFQIYRLDDNSYLQEADRLSFWTRGNSRAQMLIKADRPFERMQFRLSADRQPTTVALRVNGRRALVALEASQTLLVQLALGPGFPYKKDRTEPAYVWVLTIDTGAGFTPADTGSHDTRYLGARVLPLIVK
ncbi:MAG: hypothetical protein ABIP90_02615 [Vicinamibacterales bacterium]